MSNLTKTLCITAAGLLISAGAASAADRPDSPPVIRAAAAETLQQAPSPEKSHYTELAGERAWDAHARWMTANLMERADAEHDTILNRYNLAAAYEATGRLDLAASIYRTLVVDGRFTRLPSLQNPDDPSSRPQRFNVALQSWWRLAVIGDAERSTGRGGTLAYFSTSDPSLSNFRNGMQGHISDERARQLDEAEAGARGQ